MTIEPTFPAQIAQHFHTPADRAFTPYRNGQMTLAYFEQIPLADPLDDTVTPIARVATRSRDAFDFIGIDSQGWLLRGEFNPARYTPRHLATHWYRYLGLPYLRVVNDTGYALPDPFPPSERTATQTSVRPGH